MSKRLTLLVVFLILSSFANGTCATLEVKQTPATMEGVLGLANKYTGWCEPKLTDQDKDTVARMKKSITDNKFSNIYYRKALDETITQLTVKLASCKSLDGLMVASAYIVTHEPKNHRALNLFGSVLHTYDKYKDAIVVFQYMLSLDPKNVLTRLNMANAYLDANQDDKAKTILDKLEVEDSSNKAVYRALATYWYKKKNASKLHEYLFKAAKFKGYKRKKAEKKQEVVEQNEVKGGESTDEIEIKLKQLECATPLTPADVLEEDFPSEAQQIRDKYCKLQTDEKWILPKLPMVNLNGPPDFVRNQPIVEEWVKVAIERLQIFQLRKTQHQGVDINASDKVQEAQARAAGRKQATEALQNALDMIKRMENMPGVSKADIAKAKREIEKAAKDQNLQVEEKPVDTNEPLPGFDSGGLFTEENYRNYVMIESSYAKYFHKYYAEYQAKVMDIIKVFSAKAQAEIDRFDAEWQKIMDEEKYQGIYPTMPDEQLPVPLRKIRLEHRKRLNGLSDSYYRQWSGLYFPQYTQKMKPTLDAYFNICMLYIRNMKDPKVMEREYDKVTLIYSMFATQAVSGIGGGGFPYYPEVDEEERALEVEIARAKEEAEVKKDEFKREFKSPEFSFTKWIDDHFVLELSAEFLALKVTTHSIEFEAAVPRVSTGAKYDFTDEKFETYTGVGMKLEVGMNICGLGGKLEAGGEAYRRTATWDLKNGTYAETDTAKVEATAKLGPFLSAGGEFQLDAQLNAKVSSKVSLMGTTTIQGETSLN